MQRRLLLDTNILLWTIAPHNKISPRARREMARPAATLFVSIISVWEVVVKHQVGKLRFPRNIEEVTNQILYDSSWTVLPLKTEHLRALIALPMLHRDPFDRLLIAQAQHEGMTIVTADERIKEYDVRTLW